MNNQHFVGDIVRTVIFEDLGGTSTMSNVITSWLIQDVGHKIDIMDIALLQDRMDKAGYKFEVKLKPTESPNNEQA